MNGAEVRLAGSYDTKNHEVLGLRRRALRFCRRRSLDADRMEIGGAEGGQYNTWSRWREQARCCRISITGAPKPAEIRRGREKAILH